MCILMRSDVMQWKIEHHLGHCSICGSYDAAEKVKSFPQKHLNVTLLKLLQGMSFLIDLCLRALGQKK